MEETILKQLTNFDFNGQRIPEYMHGGIARYIAQGVPPGDFLQAVFSNDLMEAFGRADDTNIQCLKAYVGFLYNEAPSQCYGSADNYQAWIDRRGMQAGVTPRVA